MVRRTKHYYFASWATFFNIDIRTAKNQQCKKINLLSMFKSRQKYVISKNIYKSIYKMYKWSSIFQPHIYKVSLLKIFSNIKNFFKNICFTEKYIHTQSTINKKKSFSTYHRSLLDSHVRFHRSNSYPLYIGEYSVQRACTESEKMCT